jgi:hypothetical protein
MIVALKQPVTLTVYGKPAIAAFPQPLENPPGFPQTHSLDDGSAGLTSYRGTHEGKMSPMWHP